MEATNFLDRLAPRFRWRFQSDSNIVKDNNLQRNVIKNVSEIFNLNLIIQIKQLQIPRSNHWMIYKKINLDL